MQVDVFLWAREYYRIFHTSFKMKYMERWNSQMVGVKALIKNRNFIAWSTLSANFAMKYYLNPINIIFIVYPNLLKDI